MYSGKSSAILRYVSRAKRSHKIVDVVVPRIDTRSKGQVKTHNGQSLATLGIHPRVVDTSRALYDGVPVGTDFVVVDEAQFFDLDLPLYVDRLVRCGVTVVCAGLDQTSEGNPFGPMPHLLSLATVVEKLTAICPCGSEANRTLCLAAKQDTILVGGEDKYLPACTPCWLVKGRTWPDPRTHAEV